MITSKQGNIHIEGCKPEVKAEFAIIAKALIDEKVLTAEELHDMVQLAQKSEQEIEKELSEKTKSMIKRFSEEFAESLKDLFGEL